MDIRQQVLDKYAEFNQFLESINLEELRNQFTRAELNEFKSQLYDAKVRRLAYDIGNLTKQMKEEEFPQLLAVHRFPILNEINFLSEQQKIKLDEHLVRYRVGNYVGGLWQITRDHQVEKQLRNWLLEKGIIEKAYVVLCPHCSQGHISNTMSEKEREELNRLFDDYKQTGDYDLWEKLSKIMDNGCMDCDDYTEIDDMDDLFYTDYLKMKAERDKSLDKA